METGTDRRLDGKAEDLRTDFRSDSESGNRPLKVGVDLIACETAMCGETPRWTDIRAMAETAEAAGFDSIWVPDHFLVPADFWLSSGERSAGLGNWE
jgi:hypothetical protein